MGHHGRNFPSDFFIFLSWWWWQFPLCRVSDSSWKFFFLYMRLFFSAWRQHIFEIYSQRTLSFRLTTIHFNFPSSLNNFIFPLFCSRLILLKRWKIWNKTMSFSDWINIQFFPHHQFFLPYVPFTVESKNSIDRSTWSQIQSIPWGLLLRWF